MKEPTAKWIQQAAYDFETAEAMFKTKRYVYVVFMCHLALEKMLKAAYTETKDDYPPRIHSLTTLASKASVNFPDELKDFVHSMSNMSIPTRYDDEVRDISGTQARSVLAKSRKAMKWLRRQLK
jgi:HEPN domain-containing protein